MLRMAAKFLLHLVSLFLFWHTKIGFLPCWLSHPSFFCGTVCECWKCVLLLGICIMSHPFQIWSCGTAEWLLDFCWTISSSVCMKKIWRFIVVEMVYYRRKNKHRAHCHLKLIIFWMILICHKWVPRSGAIFPGQTSMRFFSIVWAWGKCLQKTTRMWQTQKILLQEESKTDSNQ